MLAINMPITIPKLLTPEDPEFPPIEMALTDPNGLLAIGGDLNPERLLQAYQRGIFPWYNSGQPILWWSPDPRAVLWPKNLKVSRSLAKTLKKHLFTVTYDQAFSQVIAACAAPRQDDHSTWISAAMQAAYCELHRLGHAHSVEIWDTQHNLVGGLYGVSVRNKIFSGESMFNRAPDMAKIALFYLKQWSLEKNYLLIDCQINNPFLQSMGAEDMPRAKFIELLTK